MNPTTGADSVPFPEGPCSDDEWRAYKWACGRAAFAETIVEAVTRCCRDAGEFGCATAFYQCGASVIKTYDDHFARGEEQFGGMSLDECSPVGEWVLSGLSHHWSRMAAAWSVMDRDEYVKAANDFSLAAAILATGLGIAEHDKNR